MAKRKRGRGTVFSPQQNQALRTTMREIEGRYTSQRAFGEALGIEQQNVGRLLKDRRAGFGYTTASTLVRLAGFANVDAFFAKKGLAPESSSTLEDVSHAHAS